MLIAGELLTWFIGRQNQQCVTNIQKPLISPLININTLGYCNNKQSLLKKKCKVFWQLTTIILHCAICIARLISTDCIICFYSGNELDDAIANFQNKNKQQPREGPTHQVDAWCFQWPVQLCSQRHISCLTSSPEAKCTTIFMTDTLDKLKSASSVLRLRMKLALPARL